MKDFNVAEWSIKHVQIVFFFILAILILGAAKIRILQSGPW